MWYYLTLFIFIFTTIGCSKENKNISPELTNNPTIFETFNEDSIISSFDNRCTRWVNGYTSDGLPAWGSGSGICDQQNLNTPLLISVSHENNQNNHFGDANYSSNIVAYMSDYDPGQIGKWLNFAWWQPEAANQSPIMNFVLDTLNFPTTNVTGRNVRDGFMFLGLNDLKSANTSLDKEIYVELELKVLGAQLEPQLWSKNLSAQRLILGASITWSEPGRKNTSHFVELNLFKSENFFSDKHSICPSDFSYDFCYSDPNGNYAEGKYFDIEKLGFTRLKTESNQWQKYSFPLSEIIKKYKWQYPPQDWSKANMTIYLGVESRGASRLWTQIKNYKIIKRATPVVQPNPTPPPSVLPPPSSVVIIPKGVFRINSAGYYSNGEGDACLFKSGAHLFSCGGTQSMYDNAKVYTSMPNGMHDRGPCGCGIYP